MFVELAHRQKKNKVLNYLKNIQADICLIQETHLSQFTQNNLKTTHFNHCFSSYYNSKQRGVCILINKNIQFNHHTTVSDPEGRFIIINISINNNPITIGNIYGPNSDDPSFFSNVFSSLSNLSSCPIIIGGDYNTVINPTLDRSKHTSKFWQSSKTIKQFMSDFGLGDGWRLQHPQDREYTFYSNVHQTYSRIDLFLTSNSIIPNIIETKIHPISISDHSPVTLTWNTPAIQKHPTRWRFNTSLLKDPEFDSYFKREWTSFLEINDSLKSPASLLWETWKVVLRGKIISYSVHKKKKEKEVQLEEEIKKLEILHANNPLETIHKELRKNKFLLNEIINKRNQFLIHRLRQETFHHSNKSGKYLASQIKRNKEKTAITSIMNSAEKLTNSPLEINKIFEEYYTKLYSSDLNPNQEDINQFLDNIPLPKLNTDQINSLELPITEEELHSALNHMQNNKAPGPDGFPAEFYKHFWSTLFPLFSRTITEIKQNAKIPSHMNTALISLIPKPNKDHTLTSNYRPISLINVDLKIISKVLSHRIEKIIPDIIHPDQTGFIKGRHASNNTRRLYNLMHYSSVQQKDTLIATLDAEKAFDRVNWKFLFTTLQKFGFGESFINWIKILYTSPSATVTTNGLTSQSFTLHRGTRQGCPLSPSLFTIFIEPLAAAIRQNPSIKGIETPQQTHKISLYADDILLFIQEPPTSIQEIIKTIQSFSKISDYAINWNKSFILPLHKTKWDVAPHQSPIPICQDHITYLGIKISSRLSELVTLNFTPLLKTIEEDLLRWLNLPISITGRIAAIKMTILPKINYLFSMIPTHPTLTWFKSLDSIITHFYWKNKTPRIKLTTLQKSKAQGGLEAPNFHYYSMANQLQYIYKWTHHTQSDIIWLDIEQSLCKELNIADIPFLTKSIKHHTCFNAVTIASTLTAWWKFHQITNSILAPSNLTPLWNNPDFISNKKNTELSHMG